MKLTKLSKAFYSFTASALIAFGALSSAAEAKPKELKMAFYQNENHIFVKQAREILPKLEERTEGRYKFGIYSSEALGKAAEQLDITNRGLTFASLICICYYPGTFPLFNIETLPLWSNGVKGVQDTFDGGLGELYEKYFHSKGLNNIGYLGATAFSVRSLGTRNKKITVPADFKELRVRALGFERFSIQKAGGSVLTMPMPQVMEALERNMLDGVMAQESNWIDWKLYEGLKYINFIDLTTSPMSIIYSIKDLKKIPEEDQKIVLEVITEYKDTLAKEYGNFMDESRDFLINTWEGEAFYPTEEEKRQFIDLAHDGLVEEFLSKAGEMGPEAVELVKKFNP